MPSVNNEKKDKHQPSPGDQASGFSRQFAMAMELPFVIVSAVAVGGVLGYFLDRWLHSAPVLMLLLGGLGLLAGLRDVLNRVKKGSDA